MNEIAESLRRTAGALRALVEPLDGDTLRWKPPGGGWSILEVLCHLADEEKEDFRARLGCTLRGEAWPPIDPEGWARTRGYAERDPAAELARFLAERRRSLAWLEGLGAIDPGKAHVHPKLGSLRAGDLLASWAAHDLLHLRQITRLLHERLRERAQPFDTGYAGKW